MVEVVVAAVALLVAVEVEVVVAVALLVEVVVALVRFASLLTLFCLK